MSNPPNTEAETPRPTLAAWLERKIAEAEQTLKNRESLAAVCRTGTNAEWASAANMHPSTAGLKSKKADRLKEADGHDRIAARMRHDVAMWQELQAERLRGAELAEALAYWLPLHEPLYAQYDDVSMQHRRKWHAAKSLLAAHSTAGQHATKQ